jgi:hypothetical protein
MFRLDRVVPWGRSFDEYRHMFDLGDDDLRQRILSCADGPASFNAVATRRGAMVVSCDPIYRFDADDIRQRIEATRQTILEETRRNADEFVWSSIRSIEDLEAVRMAAMNEFLGDFPAGKEEDRYVDVSLPSLPWLDSSFDLALCSHFLFLYSDQLDLAFHERSIVEMCRVADEVRIFPLLAFGGERSGHLEPVTHRLADSGHRVAIKKVPYEFQRGGNEMMLVSRG